MDLSVYMCMYVPIGIYVHTAAKKGASTILACMHVQLSRTKQMQGMV